MILYVRILALFFTGLGVVGGALKIASDDADDLLHSVLHFATGIAAGAIGFQSIVQAARVFCLGFGAFYFLLGALGTLWPDRYGLLPLGWGDHVFHLTVGGLTLAAGGFATRAARA